MVILVNGEPAVIKENSSFEYVSENPDFREVSDYTLSISFPLKGCEINKRLFGYMGRPDEAWVQRSFSATLQAGRFIRHGCLSIVEASDEELKAQFFVGRSEANYKFKLDECYIDELDLGAYSSDGNGVDMSCIDGIEALPLPWVNNNTDSGLIQNITIVPTSQEGSPSKRRHNLIEISEGRSYMPFVLFLAKKIAQQMGLVPVFTQWENSDKRFLLCCNTLPAVWDIKQFARALPHWSVQEFFYQLGYILDGDFAFDFIGGKLSFAFRNEPEVVPVIRLIDGFSVEMSTEEIQYVGSDLVRFADRGDEPWKFLSCPWVIQKSKVVSFDSFTDLKRYILYDSGLDTYNTDGRPASWGKPDGINNVYYAADIDTHFALDVMSVSDAYTGYDIWTKLRPVNVFGPRNYSSDEEAKSREIKILPVRIDEAGEYGSTVFLEPKSYDEKNIDYEEMIKSTPIARRIRNGEADEKPSYYDYLLVGYWSHGNNISINGRHCPDVDIVEMVDRLDIARHPLGLRLRGSERRKFGKKIDGKTKFTFNFLAEDLPDVNAVFYIEGYYYVCAKITATINAYGLSQKFKGEFYRIQRDPS